MTFSIAACDLNHSPPEWGVAVASKFLSVGAAVPWARADAGAVATQALANLSYGPRGLEMLAAGKEAAEVLEALVTSDPEQQHRQVGIVDVRGAAVTFTGSKCFDWAGGRIGDGYCCQGNILTGGDVVDEMASTFESTQGELAVRLLAALRAGDAAGGDRRGRQAAALLVVREGGSYQGQLDRAVDLRVDDHQDPVTELLRLFSLHRLYFPRREDLSFVDIDEKLSGELRDLLTARGFAPGRGTGYDEELKAALFAYSGTENLEERWTEDAKIEKGVLEHLRAGP